MWDQCFIFLKQQADFPAQRRKALRRTEAVRWQPAALSCTAEEPNRGLLHNPSLGPAAIFVPGYASLWGIFCGDSLTSVGLVLCAQTARHSLHHDRLAFSPWPWREVSRVYRVIRNIAEIWPDVLNWRLSDWQVSEWMMLNVIDVCVRWCAFQMVIRCTLKWVLCQRADPSASCDVRC